jgi:hypothetical protein
MILLGGTRGPVGEHTHASDVCLCGGRAQADVVVAVRWLASTERGT